MDLRIIRYKNGDITEEHWSNAELECAKDILCPLVRTGIVDRIEIRDAEDNPLFSYSRDAS